jgi:CRISPR-associated endonuclease Csn1
LNNEHALKKGKSKEEKQKIRYDLRNKLCNKKYNDSSKENYKWIFKKPWANFTQETKSALDDIVISFKQNLRVINKATNYYEKYVEKNGEKKKELVEQKGTNWAIRKSMHKDTVSGKVELQWYKTPKGKIITATRKSLDTSFDIETIESITDTGIQKILKNYLKAKDNNSELAFSPEGIEDLNKNISKYNDGKQHQPIYKVRIFELGSKFQIGQSGNKKHKYVEAAKGTNLFFAVYENENGKRSYETIPLNEVIERQKQGLPAVDLKNEKSFYLSPNDLVYLPTEDELEDKNNIDFKNLNKEQKKRLFNVNDFSSTCYFTPNFIAKNIAPKEVDLNFDEKKNKLSGSFDTKSASFEGKQIKEICIKLKVDRLGNISKA